jgi:oligopeptide transport system substrate-binding protein
MKDPSTLDPRKAHDLASTSVCFMLYEGLFRAGPNGQLENAICERYSVSNDHMTFFFKLKPAYWSDGSLITAKDFEESWLYQLDPKQSSAYSYLFFPIKNAKLYKQGLCSKDEIGIKTISEDCIKIVLEQPKNDFSNLLTFSAFFPYKSKDDAPLYNGPFCLKSYKPHQELILSKNPFYHEASNIQTPSLEIKIIDSEATALQLFNQHKLDIIGGPLSPIPAENLKNHHSDYNKSMAGATLCAFNTQSVLFSNLNLRKAFAYSIDHNLIMKTLSNHETTVNNFLPFEYSSSKNLLLDFHSKDKARHYLDLALQELNIKKEDLCKLRYFFGAKPEHLKIAQILHSCWKETLDVDIQLIKLEHKIFSSKVASKDYDLAQLVWLAPYDSPSSLLDRFYDTNLIKNFSGYSSTNLVKLIHDLEFTGLDQESLLEKIDEEFATNIPFIPIINWSYPYYISSKIKELNFTSLGTVNFTFLKVNEDS